VREKAGNSNSLLRNKRTSSTDFQFFCEGVPLPPMYTQFHPRSPNATQESAEGRNPKMRKPGRSRVKSLVSHSRPRLCVLNQISRGAQPPSAADTWVGQTPQLPDYSLLLRRLRSFSFLHLNSSYKQNTNLLYHHVSFLFNFIFIQLYSTKILCWWTCSLALFRHKAM
jgi:hypothetical protein